LSTLERFHTFIILLAVIIGLVLGQIPFIEANAGYLIVPFLLLMLYGLFLTIPIKDLKNAFLNIKFAWVSLSINFIWTPLLAWGLGAVFLADQPALWIGFIMLMVTPCTDWYLVFTAIAKGNVSLAMSILPINLLLQVILLPIYLFIFAGAIETIQLSALLESIIIVLIIPFLLANTTRFLLNKYKKQEILENKIIPFFGLGQVIFLSLAIGSMFASQGRLLIENINLVFVLLIPVLLFFLINFLLGRGISYLAKFYYEDSVSLNLTTLARNSPLSLAIAVTAFPDQPIIALALVIGPLIELPVLTIISQILLIIRKSTSTPKNS